MNRKYITAWVCGIFLGFGGGLIGGYQMAGGKHDMDQEAGQSMPDARVEASNFDSMVIPNVPFDEGCNTPTFISWFGCRTAELDRDHNGLQIAVGHPLAHDPKFAEIQFKYRGGDLTPRQLLDIFSKETGISYSIRPCAVLWKHEKSQETEKAETPAGP